MNPTGMETKPSPPSARELVSFNPATLKELGRVPILTSEQVQRAVLTAKAAQLAWGALTFRQRAAYILKAKDVLLERQDDLCQLIACESGKPALEALTSELLPGANLMDYFARKSERLLRREEFTLSVFRNKKSRIEHLPLGVVGVISPWNYPLSIPLGEVVMGLMAGNAVLLKPSEQTPLVGLQIGDLFRAAGLPTDILQVLTGDGQTGAALAESAIDKIFFTGSVRTGRKIAEASARRFLPFVLELGGKDAMIVCADAPFERTVGGALWGAFNNCGQACASVERLYVVESIAPRFIEAVVEQTKTLRVGTDGGCVGGGVREPPPSPGLATIPPLPRPAGAGGEGRGEGEYMDIGPLNNARQLEIVVDQIRDAVAGGAKILTGGRRIENLPGYFFEPTVLVNVNHSMRLMQEETFGPVLPIVTVKDEAEAIRQANDSNFGLLASVWTKDTKRGQQIASQIQAGTIIINDVLYTHGAAETPWFGVKDSGIGVTHSSHGLREFVRMKHINWDLLPLKTNPWWFPYSPQRARKFKLLLKLLHQWKLKRWV